MANYKDFENAKDSGIDCTTDIKTVPYLFPLDGIQDIIERMRVDNFYDSDRKSISQAIEDLKTLDKVVEETRILYEMYPEKRELMQKILEELAEIRNGKKEMNSAQLATDCKKYNDNMEASKEAFLNYELSTYVRQYNDDPKPLTGLFKNVKTKRQEEKVVADLRDERLFPRSKDYYSSQGWSFVNFRKYDKIQEENANKKNTSVMGSELSSLRTKNNLMKRRLNGRGYNYLPTAEKRPERT